MLEVTNNRPYVASANAASRAIVIHNDCLLVMKRSKPDGSKYMVIPGGHIEPNEMPEETVLREVIEETTLIIANPRLVYIENTDDPRWGTQYIYLCDYVSGEVILNPDSDEYDHQQLGEGTYEPLWLPLISLPDKEYEFMSPRLGLEIQKAMREGFPETPKEWINGGV